MMSYTTEPVESKKNVYMVIATIDGEKYMTKVRANSHAGAEHIVLDAGIVGKHEVAVTGCQAYDSDDMQYSYFINAAIESHTVSLSDLTDIIKTKNADIRAKDNAEARIKEIEIQMALLQHELDGCKRILGGN